MNRRKGVHATNLHRLYGCAVNSAIRSHAVDCTHSAFIRLWNHWFGKFGNFKK